MSEHVVEAELDSRRVLASFSMMAGHGEGIYASPTSADVGLQPTDQIGLTLPPKTTSGAELPLDAFAISDQDFEDALRQLEPLLADAEGRTSSFRADATHGSCRRYIAPPAKRRKLCGDLYEPLLQKSSSPPAIWPISPTVKTVLSEPVNFCVENPHHDGNKVLSPKPSGLPISTTHGIQETIRPCQEDVGNAPPSTYGKTDFLEETDPSSAASKSSRHASTDNCGVGTAGSDCAGLKKDLKDQAGRVQNSQDSEMSNEGTFDGESADVMNHCHGKVFWDPDVPMQSIEEENPGLCIDHSTDMPSSRSSNSDQATLYGVPIGFPSAACQTIAGSRSVAANETTRKYVTLQDSLKSSRTSLQTSTLTSIARLFLQKSQQALYEGYSKSLSTHQIPAELRERFHALLRKYQSDEQFQKAVAAYAMELSGTVSPGETDPILIPLRLRQAFDALFKKWRTEEEFRMSLDKFATEFLREKKSSEDVSSGVMGPADNILGGKLKPKNLDGLSIEQLTMYCRELEYSRAQHVKVVQSVKEFAKSLEQKLANKPRVTDHPVERNPNPDTWTCFHIRTKGKDNREEPCGRVNPHFDKKLIWQVTTHCKTCKGPYNEDFKLQKLKNPKKKYYKSKKVDENAAPDTRQSPANAQANNPANPQLSDFPPLSSTQQDPVFGTFSAQMYDHPGEDEQIDTPYLSQGWHSGIDACQHTPMSDGFHSAPIVHPFPAVNDSTTRPSPMHNTGLHPLNMGTASSLKLITDFSAQDGEFDQCAIDSDPLFAAQDGEFDELAIDSDPLFTAQDGEFDELAIDSDPLFMDMDIDPNPQQAGSFLEQTNMYPEDFPQFAPSSEQLANHYPAQVNLFPQHISSLSQAHTSPSLPLLDKAVGYSKNGATSVSTSLSIQQHEHNINWAPTKPEQLYEGYQSPHGPINSSTLPKFATSAEEGLPTGTRLSFPSNLPHMQNFLPSSQPDHMMTNSGPAITVTDADSDAPMPGAHEVISGPHPWPSRGGKRLPPMLRSRKVQNGRGRGWKASLSPTKKTKAPSKTPRPSRSKAAVAERAARRAAESKTPEPEKPFTEVQMNRVRTRNTTSARFLGGPRKSWEEPLQEAQRKVIIEIPDDNVAVPQSQEEMGGAIEWELELEATQMPQGAVNDQGAINDQDLLDDELTAEFNAEFARQDQAATLEAAADESEISEEE